MIKLSISLIVWVVLGMWLAGFQTACTWAKKDAADQGAIRVQVPFFVDGGYHLQVVDLWTLRSLSQVSGGAARFLMDPDSVSGRIQGRPPVLNYLRDLEGVVIARDDLSLQLLTVYTHFERLQQMDEAMGAQGLLSYPRTIAVNAKYRSTEGRLENNALYSGQFDALLWIPYTKNELPLMVNGGVLGHEHFHALFYRLFVLPLGTSYPQPQAVTAHDQKQMEQLALGDSQDSESTENDDKLTVVDEQTQRMKYHAVLLRGINEGLADVWGWLYSGDTQFVGRSLPSEKLVRNLDTPAHPLMSQKNLEQLVEMSSRRSPMLQTSYVLGGQLARVIKSWMEIKKAEKSGTSVLSASDKQEMGKRILATLVVFREKWKTLSASQSLSLSDFISVLAQQAESLSAAECEHLESLMTDSAARAGLISKCPQGGVQ